MCFLTSLLVYMTSQVISLLLPGYDLCLFCDPILSVISGIAEKNGLCDFTKLLHFGNLKITNLLL